MQQKKDIWERKCTCKSCGNIWFYGKKEVMEQHHAEVFNSAKNEGCAGTMGCLPVLVIPNKEVIDLDKCPKCGSKDIIKEVVHHEV